MLEEEREEKGEATKNRSVRHFDALCHLTVSNDHVT